MIKKIYIKLVLVLLLAIPLIAEENSDNLFRDIIGLSNNIEDNDEAGNTSYEGQQKLFVHGYLTQAYARTGKYASIGIDKDGTADYRQAALQFRYALTDKDNFVIQFSHERIGNSPVMEYKNDVELDWVFYQHYFTDATSIKIGKIQIPMGIYNEIRDVGTILPFYRPIYSFYFEGAYASETVDGFVFSHRLGLRNDWSLDLDFYYGRWDIFMLSDKYYKTEAKNGLGFQAWVNTPIENIKFGIGAQRYTSSRLALGLSEECSWNSWFISADLSYDRFKFQTEYKNISWGNGWYHTYYAILGAKIFSKFMVNFAAEFSDVHIELLELLLSSYPEYASITRDMYRDYSVGLNYYFRPDLVAKFESHWNKGFWYDEIPFEYILFDIPWSDKYFILSLSVSF